MNGTLIGREKTSPSSQDNGPPTRDENYWIQGDFIVFKVENSLFRVPGYQLIRHSVVFADMFNLPQREQNEGGSREGSDDKNPIVLPQTVTADDFRNFLKAIYPQTASKNISSGLSKEELMSVLKLSTMWYFLEYRAEAIVRLPSLLTPAEMIAIGRQYNSFALMEDGMSKLIARNENPGHGNITDEEAILMGPMTAVALYRFRAELKYYDKSLSGFETLYTKLKFLDTNRELKLIKQEELGYTVIHTT
ncbi:hypothetical protein BJ912DRAFT_878295 [Pholiota molesta]|nr:hypothetical protein BJ912DRAFT_878295 [Pholiota molesta]